MEFSNSEGMRVMKTQLFANIWKGKWDPFAPSNYAPDIQEHKTFKS